MGWSPVLGNPTAFVIALTRSHRAWPGERRRSEGINSFCMLIAGLDEERLWLCLYRSKNLLMPLSGAFRAVIGHPCQAGLCARVLWSWLNVDLYTQSFETIKMRSTRCLDLMNSLLQTWARAPIILVRTLPSFMEEQSLFLPISYQLLLSVVNREEENQPAAAPAKRLSDSLGGFLFFFRVPLGWCWIFKELSCPSKWRSL